MTGVAAFVRGYLDAIGARADLLGNGALRVQWPPTHVAAFGRETRLSFEPAVAAAADAELCVVGSDLLDRILADASTRGLHCVARVDAAGGPTPDDVVAANLAFPNAEATVLASERGVVPYVLFSFRVSLVTDEKREQFRSILVNAETGEPHRVADVFLEESLTLPEEPVVSGADLVGAYRAACLALERAILPDVDGVRTHARALLAEELARIEGFYEASIQELYEGRAREPLEAERVLRAERERRTDEARRKFRLVVEARLVNARTILIPTTTLRLRVASLRAATEVGLEYDAVNLETNRPTCASCGARTTVAFLCRGGHLVCEGCRQGCAFCDDAACRTCAPSLIVRCDACVRPLCPDHAHVDAIGRRPYCGEHARSCAICGRTVGPPYWTPCGLCGQHYCAACVGTGGRCATCRELAEASVEDPDIVRVLAEPGSPKGATRWLRGANGRVTVVVGRGRVFEHVFVLDREGRIVHRRKGTGLVRR